MNCSCSFPLTIGGGWCKTNLPASTGLPAHSHSYLTRATYSGSYCTPDPNLTTDRNSDSLSHCSHIGLLVQKERRNTIWGPRATGTASTKDHCRSLCYFFVPGGQCSIGTVAMSNVRATLSVTTYSITDLHWLVKPLSTD